MSPLEIVVKRFVPSQALSTLRSAKGLTRLAVSQLRREYLSRFLPLKPMSISLMANDVCNSRCEMCAIWKDQVEKGPTLDELGKMLRDPLFANVRDIGITGGEPTLRRDLPQMYRVAAESLPSLNHASIITNAIQPDRVIQRVLDSRDICESKGVGFSVMISLDGIDDVHDRVRGWAGNFERAVRVIDALRQENVRLSLGCTITRTNAHHVDELLEWAIARDLPIRFRVAEFIDRLYNNSQGDVIRNFDDHVAYHLGLFFTRLAKQYEKNQSVQKTYLSIRGMLAEGRKRSTGCPYHHEAVIVSAQRDLLYCSPKSPILGNIVDRSAEKIFFENLDVRERLKRDKCEDCIHDYHVPPNFSDKIRFYLKSRTRARRYDIDKLVGEASKLSAARFVEDPNILSSRSVLIVGWYGTETVGDKAILWSHVRDLRERETPPERIVLASFNPFVSEWTRREMKLGDVDIVETYGPEFERACETVDEVIIGGGPLMGLQSLDHMLFAFIAATQRGAVARIAGCGIGPLVENRHMAVVRSLARLSAHISLRDTASARLADQEFGCSAEVVEDPAINYIESFAGEVDIPREPLAAFFLRDLPKEYVRGDDYSKVDALREHFETTILEFMARLWHERRWALRLQPMCHVWEGGDDRIINRRLAQRLVSEFAVPSDAIAVDQLPTSPELVVDTMRRASLSVCMRYHSVVFAEKLQLPYLAIDYTSGGKIASFLADLGKGGRAIAISDISAESLADCLIGIDSVRETFQ